MTNRIKCRSLLWTSAMHEDTYQKAEQSGADICIIDLEDAVASYQKNEARTKAISFLKESHNFPYGIRINSIRTIDGLNDLRAISDSQAKPAMIVIPMVESPEEIIIANEILKSSIDIIRFCAIIETAKGFRSIFDIASVKNNLAYLHCGPADLAADLGVSMDNWPGMDYTRTQVILAARSAAIEAIEATDFNICDIDIIKKNCLKAKKFGFIGKSAIHPIQIQEINNAFTPTESEIIEAEKIIDAFEKADGSIVVVDGKMVGPPIVRAAKQVFLYA